MLSVLLVFVRFVPYCLISLSDAHVADDFSCFKTDNSLSVWEFFTHMTLLKRLVNDLNNDTRREVCCCRIRYVGL